ncbi:MAG: 1-deoxy-D-xylulose-5-phosphate reductoisomerase [Succinivibrio sp.]|nr:1-deoxy-D-xylulose-5-phosphate reductoisomerase [Succinivibrio sp.]
MTRQVVLLGATGSIGQSTLEVLRRNPSKFTLVAAAACSNVEAMVSLAEEFKPQIVALADVQAASELKDRLGALKLRTEVASGLDGVLEVAAAAEGAVAVAAIVGAGGLKPILEAAGRGCTIALANKEALVMSGQLFFAEVQRGKARVLPVDSEHSAIFQSLPESAQQTLGHCDLEGCGVHRILLTGSGGPFLHTPLEELPHVTPQQALRHPNWSMGPKITVDSATMMNKGLEYIEARYLFNAAPEQVEVLIHPQSVVHSMVSYQDGAVLAQLGLPDMKTPIARALAYPGRVASGVAPLNFAALGELSFCAPDLRRFPCLKLAMEASVTGQSATTALNAANEQAVAAFLAGKLPFDGICNLCRQVVESLYRHETYSLEDIMSLDAEARTLALRLLEKC